MQTLDQPTAGMATGSGDVLSPELEDLRQACLDGCIPEDLEGFDSVFETVREGFRADPDSFGPAERLARCVALLARIRADLQRLDDQRDDPAEAGRMQAEILLDHSRATSIMAGLQQSIDELVGSGRLAEARELSRFSHAVRKIHGEIPARLAAPAVEDEPVGEQAFAVPRVIPVAPVDEHGWAKISSRRSKRQRGSRTLPVPRLPNRTEVFTAALAVLVTIWLFAVRIPQSSIERLPLLSAADLPDSPAIVTVDSRPPSLFVTVDAQLWHELGSDPVRGIVLKTSQTLSAKGYTGALFVTEDGVPVAQWLEESGVRALSAVEHDPVGPGLVLPTVEKTSRPTPVDR